MRRSGLRRMRFSVQRHTWVVWHRAVRLLRAVDGTQLVAVRVAHIAEVHRAAAGFAQSWRVLAGRPAMGHAYIVKRLDLLGRVALETNRAAIADGSFLAVDGLGDTEQAAVMAVEQTRVPGWRHIAQRLACAEYAEHGIVKRPEKRRVGEEGCGTW